MGTKKTIRHLAGAEGYLTWAEEFCKEKKWAFGKKAFWACLHRIFTDDYGKGWRRSSEYKTLKRKIIVVYKMFPAFETGKKMHLLMILYRVSDRLAAFMYRMRINRKD